MSLHPASRLLFWLVLLAGVQFLEGVALMAAFPALLLLGPASLRRGLRLVRRARWLLLSLFVIFSWGIAGEPLWGGFSPTREGVSEAFSHAGRLLLVLMLVAGLLEKLPVPDLLTGMYRLTRPLRRCGFDAERGVVRLMLVLQYVESLPRPRDWRVLLSVPSSPEPQSLTLADQPFRWPDLLLALSGALFLPFAFLALS